MEFWNNVVQAAMLGTDKKQPGTDDLSEDMLTAVNTINRNEPLDTEERFLQVAAVAFNYRQSGVMPLLQTAAVLPVAQEEGKQYCSADALQALKDILYEENNGLLKIWLQLCVQHQQIITPELIPMLLEKSVYHKQLKPLVQQCIGNRGVWLSQFNKDWSFAGEISNEELWQTGTPEERKQVLLQLRNTDTVKAREWLQQTWTQESANTKAEFLKIFTANLTDEDIKWLETLLNEKSQKVREAALDLLKQIPASTIIQKYYQLLKESVSIKKEKVLLGFSSKTSLQFELPGSIDESIFKSGIEKLSNTKEFTDDEFVIYQIIQFVPPAFWEQHLFLSPEEIINLFQKDEIKKKFLPALVIAVTHFKDTKWAMALMQNAQVFYLDIIPLLPLQQQEFYGNKFFTGHEESIIAYALQRETEWSAELAQNIFRHTAKKYYSYNRSFYNNYIHLTPVQVIEELEKCTPAEEYLRNTWNNTSEYITKLVTLKIQTIKAFSIKR